jgi:uncharacterized protein (TIGR02271 family)
MPKTIVGLFPNAREAQNVKHELVNQGYLATEIQVVANSQPTKPDGTANASGDAAADTGIAAKIASFFHSLTGAGEEADHYTQKVEKGGALLTLTVADGQEEKAADLLEQHGARDVEDQDAQRTSAAAVGGSTSASSSRERSEDAAIPVVAEELLVGKRQVQRGGVRVYSHMVEQPVEDQVELREEHVRVDRRNVDRPATEADFTDFKEGTIELTETAEEAVVSKRARVVEEIVVGKESSERTQIVKDSVRRTEVEVEQLDANDNLVGATDPNTSSRST